MSDKAKQHPGGISGIGDFKGKPVSTRKSKTNTQTGVGSRSKSTKND
jgi:hypothetical protein